MSVLNNQFSKELNAIDESFGKLLDSVFALTSPYFYTPNAHNTQLIANTFDIDIQDEPLDIALKLTTRPLLKKTKMGTYSGIQEVIYPIFGEVKLQTHATNPHIEPFTFRLDIEPTSVNIIDLQRAQRYINQYKPLRDNNEGINIDFPQGEICTDIASFGRFGIDFSATFPFSRTLSHSVAQIGAIAVWDMSF